MSNHSSAYNINSPGPSREESLAFFGEVLIFVYPLRISRNQMLYKSSHALLVVK